MDPLESMSKLFTFRSTSLDIRLISSEQGAPRLRDVRPSGQHDLDACTQHLCYSLESSALVMLFRIGKALLLARDAPYVRGTIFNLVLADTLVQNFMWRSQDNVGVLSRSMTSFARIAHILDGGMNGLLFVLRIQETRAELLEASILAEW